MGQIHNIEKLTDCKFLNLYHLNATSIHNTPVSYFVASRAKSINELKIKTGKNTPDGVIIYSLYGEKRDRVVSTDTQSADISTNSRQVWSNRTKNSMRVQ
mgnify:CR=1 FL=1